MSDESPVRIKGVGRIPRVLSIVIFVLFETLLLADYVEDGDEKAIGAAVVPLCILLRSLFIRVELRESTVFVASWFRNYSFPVADLKKCECDPYAGMISYGSSVSGPFGFGMKMLTLDSYSRTLEIELPCTLMRRKTARRAQAQINAFLEQHRAAAS